MNRTGQHLRTTPARFFLRCGLSFFLGVDLVFFKGCRVGRQCFLWDEGVFGSVFFFLEKHHYPFDL